MLIKYISERWVYGMMALVLLLALFPFTVQNFAFGSNATRGTPDCTVTTFEPVAIGGSNSVTVLAENRIRSYARIEQLLDVNGVATSTVFVSFDNGEAATTASPFTLATSTQRTKEFGMNTDFAYTGAVTAITNVIATTSIRVTECSFR